jgi:pSer/pThr/pTyr-binding forkhead associated (FHA) protein
VKVTVLKNNSPLSEASWKDAEIEDGFEAYIGRSEDCHVLIDDPLISRHHLVLRLDKGVWTLERLTHIAAVTVNGQAVHETLGVNQGDLISLPPYSLILDSLPGTARTIKAATPVVDATMDDGIVQATQTGMRDDIPRPENIDATKFLSATLGPPQAVKTATLPMSDRTQHLVEEIINDDLEVDALSDDLGGGEDLADLAATGEIPTSEGFEELGAADDLGGLDFKGEEDVIGSEPLDDSDEPTEAGGEQNFSNFDGNDGTQADTDMPVAVGDSGGETGDSTRVLQTFASYELILFGEFAPYDRYAIELPEIFIGRDPKKCQIVLNDSEVSSVHAVLRKNMVSLVLEDLNSSNGTLLNGQRINKSDIVNGDEFIVGSTTFTVQVISDLLKSEGSRLMPVEAGQVIESIEEVEEEIPIENMAPGAGGVDFNGNDASQEKSIIKRIMKDPKKKRIAMILGVLLLIAFLMEEPEKKAPKKADPAKDKVAKDAKPPEEKKNTLSPEQIRALEARYKIAESYVKDKKLDEALAELEQILAVDPNYANAKTLFVYVQNQNKLFKDEQERLKTEAEKARVREEVKAMLVEAKEAVTARNVTRAEQLFAQILERDPENLEVTPLKQEIEVWQAQERAKAEAEARAKTERSRMVDSLAPGKKLYLSKEWQKAIAKLEEFLTIKQMDEDLIKEAGDMLGDAKAQMASEIAPLLGKARSLKEGQDLKGAYESYLQVLAIDPTNKEGLDEVDGIRELLDTRSKKIYREAIISESLSLFGDAKEKFQEVQSISPTDSEYYKKASEKLKNYLE